MRRTRRLATWTAIIVLIFTSGCGEDGKDGKKGSASGAASGTAEQPKTTAAVAEIFPPVNLPAGHAGIVASYVTPDDFAAVVLHPRRLAESPLVANELKQESVAAAIKNLGVAPSEVEELVMLFHLDKTGKPTPLAYLRFTHDVNLEDLLNKFHSLPKEKDTKPFAKETIDGKTCYSNGVPDVPVAFAASKSTIVLAMKDDIGGVLAGTKSEGSLFERLRRTDAACDAVVMFEADKYPDLAKVIDENESTAPQWMEPYLRLSETLRAAAVTVDLTGDKLLQLVLTATDPAAAAEAQDVLDDGKKVLAGAFTSFEQGQSPENQQKYAEAFKTGEQAIDSIAIAHSGNQVTATIARPAGLDNAGPWIEDLRQALAKILSQPAPPPAPPSGK